MVVEVTDNITEHKHVFEDKWYPLDKKHVRRVCVLPGCHKREVKNVSKA